MLSNVIDPCRIEFSGAGFSGVSSMKLFLHMPKCAGTSVYRMINKRLGSDCLRDYDSFFRVPIPKRYLKISKFLASPAPVSPDSLVYGHFFPIKYTGLTRNNDIKMVTILRDPARRMLSHYNYWNSLESENHYLWEKMKSQKWSFHDFAFSREMRNFYAQYFFGVPVSKFSYIGIYENLENSIERCFSELGIPSDDDNDIPHLNVSPKSTDAALSGELLDKFKEFHAKDYAIYNYACDTFHR